MAQQTATPPPVNALEEISRALGKAKDALKATLTRNGKDPSALSESEQVQVYLDLVVQKGVEHLNTTIGSEKAKDAVKQAKGKGSLKETILQTGLEAFLKQMELSWLQYTATVLGLDKSDKHEDLVRSAQDEIQLLGTKRLLSETDKATLVQFCQGLGLKADGSKDQLIEALMVEIFQLEPLTIVSPSDDTKRKKDSSRSSSTPKKKPKKEKSAENSSAADETHSGDEGEPKEYTPRGAQRPPIENIKKGMTYTQLYDLYNKTDLDEFCRQHDLPVSGKKKDLIKKILTFLDGKDPSAKSAKKSRKSAESGASEPDSKATADSADGSKPMETTAADFTAPTDGQSSSSPNPPAPAAPPQL